MRASWRASLLLILLFNGAGVFSQSFEIRGVLPWHNFLSGPTAWNESDYRIYLDDCKVREINFIAFHNYTGGGERYFNYVEPMIKIEYKNVLPEAAFDNGSMARWGYLPMSISDYPFGTQKLFQQESHLEFFGAECSAPEQSQEKIYARAQGLMQNVLKMAHERDMQMAMGFEFGVAPPEYASIRTNPDMYWMAKGGLVYNPFDPDAAGILYATIDNILKTYKGIDWIYLWLNEHCMFGIDTEDALQNDLMADYYSKNAYYYEDSTVNKNTQFLGVWSQAYIQKAYDYIKRKSPSTKVVIGGWGSENQMALLLKGLHKALPLDIVFSMLNPSQGEKDHPGFFKEIARERKIWSIPWLEGDASLWHLQPRVESISEQVRQAHRDELSGVVAIHWRTEEIRLNFETFAGLALNHEDDRTSLERYEAYCDLEYGPDSGKKLTLLLSELDSTALLSSISSPVYYAYEPSWGRLSEEQIRHIDHLLETIGGCISSETHGLFMNNLEWLRACYDFTLLLDQVGKALEPAWELRNEIQSSMITTDPDQERIDEALVHLEKAQVEQMILVFSSRVRSRGELGELSSIIQRVWGEYLLLTEFLQKSTSK